MYKAILVTLLTHLAFATTSTSQTESSPPKQSSATKYEQLSTTFYIDNLEDELVTKQVIEALSQADRTRISSSSIDAKRRELKVTYSSALGKSELIQLLNQYGIDHPIELEKTLRPGKRYDLQPDGRLIVIDI